MSTIRFFWQKSGLTFECTRCDWCCTQPGGYVHGSESEFHSIAELQGLSFKEFVLNYCVNHQGYLSLKSITDGPCIFYRDGCTIYEHRPTQCRTFPFWQLLLENKREWKKTAQHCSGIGMGNKWTPPEILQKYNENNILLCRTPDWALGVIKNA